MDTHCFWDSERIRNSPPRSGVWRIMSEVSLETIAVVFCLEPGCTARCGAKRFLSLPLLQPRLRFFVLTQNVGQTNHSSRCHLQQHTPGRCQKSLIQEELWEQLVRSLPPRDLAPSPAVFLECMSLGFKYRALERISGYSHVESQRR